MVSKIISVWQNKKNRITILSLSSNSKAINFINIIEWNKLDSNIRCSPSYKLFRKRILEFIRPQPNSIFNVPNSLGLTYLTRLRVGLSHLREHKFRHNFRDSLNPICNCSNAIESTKHYLHHCSNFKKGRPFCKMLELLTLISYP